MTINWKRPGDKTPGPKRKLIADVRDWPTNNRPLNTRMHILETTVIILACAPPIDPRPMIPAAILMCVYLRLVLSVMANPDGNHDAAQNLGMLLSIGIYMICTGAILLEFDSGASWLPFANMLQIFAGGLVQGLVFRDEVEIITKKLLDSINQS